MAHERLITINVLSSLHSNSIEFHLVPQIRDFAVLAVEHVLIRREFAIPREGYPSLSTVQGLDWYIENLLPSVGVDGIPISLSTFAKLKVLLRRVYEDPHPLDKYFI